MTRSTMTAVWVRWPLASTTTPMASPGNDEGEGRPEQTLCAGDHEVRIGAAPPPVGRPRDSVGESADGEEDGHDLEHPREPLSPGDDGESVRDLDSPVGRDLHAHHEEVREHHDTKSDHPEQIDIPVAVDGRRGCAGWVMAP